MSHSSLAAVLMLACLVGTPAPSARADAPDQAATQPGQDEAQALTAQGRSLLRAAKQAQAEALLRKAAKARGNSIEALYELARVKFDSGDYKASRAACKPLADKDDADVLSDVCQARAFLVWRRASRAKELLERARAKDGSHPEVLLAVAELQRMSGDFAASKDTYQQLLGLHPDEVEAHYGLARLHLVMADDESAVRALREVLAREPQWVDAQYELGKLSSGPEAVRLLSQTVAARPDSVDARVALGAAQLHNGELSAAQALFREVLKKHKTHGLARARLGMALERARDFVAAEAELRAALTSVPNDVEATLSLARVYAQTDRAEEAFTTFQQAAGLERQSPRALLEAGNLAMQLSRNALAQAFLEKAVERAPDSAQAQARYADVLLARGDKEKAQAHYRLALAGVGALDRADVQRRLDALTRRTGTK